MAEVRAERPVVVKFYGLAWIPAGRGTRILERNGVEVGRVVQSHYSDGSKSWRVEVPGKSPDADGWYRQFTRVLDAKADCRRLAVTT